MDPIESKSCISSEKAKAKNDMVLIVALLVILSVIGTIYFFARTDGDTVTVTVDGEIFAEYSLSQDRTVEIRIGDNLNILVIEGGKAYVDEASCPDGVCAAHKPISRNGESIVCLPNKVVISVRTNAGENTPDIIV